MHALKIVHTRHASADRVGCHKDLKRSGLAGIGSDAYEDSTFCIELCVNELLALGTGESFDRWRNFV